MRHHLTAFTQRGLSIVELMVGIAVGLIIVAGMTKLFIDYLGNNRTMLLETRVNQDLRAAADLVVRDLRRASYWRNASSGISTNPSVAPVPNPHGAVTFASGVLTYSYAKNGDDALTAASEEFGVRRAEVDGKGLLQLQTAVNGWQTITDPGTLNIPLTNIPSTEGLRIIPTAPRVVELWDVCPCIFELTCRKGQFQNPDPGPGAGSGAKGIYFDDRPRLSIRQYFLGIRAQSSADSRIGREIRQLVRVRNDQMEGTCPL